MSGHTLQTFEPPVRRPALQPEPSATAPHTTMTFLFTDIEGSTRLWEELPEMHARVEDHFAVLRTAISDSGGKIFATMGDGVASAFQSADGAVDAAVRAQRHFQSVGLDVRMGINTGEVFRVGRDFRGRAVNRAARIMSLGRGGQVLLSDVSAALVRTGPGDVDVVNLGPHRLRDVAEPECVWQVVHPDLPAGAPTLSGADGIAHNLPTTRSSLVGRDRDVAHVVALAQQHRAVTLTGVGGVGKSRLALEAASGLAPRFTNVWFIELANVADADEVTERIALTVGASAVTDPFAATVALLGHEPSLLIIDNCEHVIEAAADTIDALLSRTRHVSVIATSREPLRIDGEHVVEVRPLEPNTSGAALFLDRAAAAGLDTTTIDHRDVELVCRRLDGLPLAIELAAARTAGLGMSAIIQALDSRMAVLNGGRRRSADRHATMSSTIDWSYRLLVPDEQRLFRWMSVFSNGFELDALLHVARRISANEESAIGYIDSLVSKSMISPDTDPACLRYRMLETMRAFGLEQLEANDDKHAAQEAHAEWVTTLTDLPVEDPCSAAVERNTIRMEREAENWRDAMIFAASAKSVELARQLCGPPAAFFLLGRHDLADLVRPLLDVCHDNPKAKRSVLCALAVSGAHASNPAQLAAWTEEVARLDAVEPTGLGQLMRWLALAWRGDFTSAVELCVEAALDPRLARSTRDMFVGIATLDHFSLTDAGSDPHGLVALALEVADRSDVGLHRVSCLLGAAWSFAVSDPEQALGLIGRALDDIPNVPALTRLTLPGSASRLLASLDPRVAARGLLTQLDAMPARRSFADLIPVFYASSLLQRVEHPNAQAALATIRVSPNAPYLSMMDFVDLARRAATTATPISISQLEALVRHGLDDLSSGRWASPHELHTLRQ
ncbi:MAG TPA: adenylate/guanylate cyclase domain-containing protein [Ilumatobacteraceae bacterium]|nr:adenylate/guanylate cyclase domain-containing protein [Ilumatobacteraceae bacterium]